MYSDIGHDLAAVSGAVEVFKAAQSAFIHQTTVHRFIASALFFGHHYLMPPSRSDQALERIEQLLHQNHSTPEQACHEVARAFSVRRDEVALLLLEAGMLRFLYPEELKATGQIPLSSSGVAARTARTKKAELFNDFPHERHHAFFESVRINSPAGVNEILPQTIQKLMSVALIGPAGNITGVIQVSRKGDNPKTAGADFGKDDLKLLEQFAGKIALLVAKFVP